nr:peptidoglycan recognition family protein [Actinomyces sp.]
MSTIVPNQAVTEVIASPNYTPGRSSALRGIIIHHWGADGQSHEQAVHTLRTRNAGGRVSAHYVVSAGRVTQLVSDQDTAYHCRGSNAWSIGIECRPEMSAGDLETLARLVAAIWAEHGHLPLSGHRDHLPTACPGRYHAQLPAIEARARAIQGGAPAAPLQPTPTAPRKDADMYLISTPLSDGTQACALVTETSGATTLDAQETGAYTRMLGQAHPLPWDWYWLLVRQAWQRRNDLLAAVGAEADEAADTVVARLQVGLAPEDGEAGA